MKLTLNLSLSLFALLAFDDKKISLTNNQISKICKKEKRVSVCIKKFEKKRDNLKNGDRIKIPVIPYKGS